MSQFKENSIAAVFQNNAQRLKNKPYCAYRGKDGNYTDLSWNEMNNMVRNLGYYLISKGIEKGDCVSIFAFNRYEWHLAALAITSIGAVDVPIYATNSSEEAEYVLEHSDAKLCMVGNNDQLERVLKVKDNLPLIEEYIIFDDYTGNETGVKTLEQALKEGKENPAEEEFNNRINSIEPDDLSTIIYTSGTTGKPKGVMLSHNNLYSNVAYTMHEMKDPNTGEFLINENDVFLSFLPLSHSLERTTGFHGAVFCGSKTAFAVDINTIMEDFVDVRPTVIICVPRIYEKIHATIYSRLEGASKAKVAMFNFATNQAKKNLHKVCKDQKIRSNRYKLADKLVFSKLKETLGMDKLRYAISGGAPLAPADAEFFIGMGLKILEGYGLTETSPILTFNRPWNIKVGTVGQKIKETELRIGEDGEVMARGPQIMLGYYKNEEATQEAITPDGFYRTGDVGEIDNEDFLRITGRIKDIIVTAGGKNISPQNIENSVKESRFIEQIAVIGDKRKYLSALVVPTFDELENWAKQQGINYNNVNELLNHPQVIDFYRNEIDERTKEFARVEQIRKFTLLDAEWTQETGELTPTQKVKRKVVSDKYADLIEKMYEDE